MQMNKQIIEDMILLDDGGAEEALEVATPRELEARNQLFCDGGTADHVAPLKDGDR